MQEERKRILNMVQEGKLTVDEALILLEGLEDAESTKKNKAEQLFGELSTAVKFEEAKKMILFKAKSINRLRIKFLSLSTQLFKKSRILI